MGELRFERDGETRLSSTADGSTLVSCQVSKEFPRADRQFWFRLERTTKESLESHPNAFCAFGLGSPDRVLLMPFPSVAGLLDRMNVSPDGDGDVLHWHLVFNGSDDRVEMFAGRAGDRPDVSRYLVGAR